MTAAKPSFAAFLTAVVAFCGVLLSGPVHTAEVEAAVPPAVAVVQTPAAVAQPISATYKHPWPSVQRWYGTALRAGWKPYEWEELSCVIRRETGGNPNLYNPERRRGTPRNWGSYGLTMIYAWANRDWVFSAVNRDLRNLYNPLTNLRIAKRLHDMRGWKPWVSASNPC